MVQGKHRTINQWNDFFCFCFYFRLFFFLHITWNWWDCQNPVKPHFNFQHHNDVVFINQIKKYFHAVKFAVSGKQGYYNYQFLKKLPVLVCIFQSGIPDSWMKCGAVPAIIISGVSWAGQSSHHLGLSNTMQVTSRWTSQNSLSHWRF